MLEVFGIDLNSKQCLFMFGIGLAHVPIFRTYANSASIN